MDEKPQNTCSSIKHSDYLSVPGNPSSEITVTYNFPKHWPIWPIFMIKNNIQRKYISILLGCTGTPKVFFVLFCLLLLLFFLERERMHNSKHFAT